MILVTGAGGFIGHHLVKRLKADGHKVRGVDTKQPEYEESAADEFKILDLRRESGAREAVWGADQVYHLAANMGGIGFIEVVKGPVIRDNTRIDLNMLDAAMEYGVKRLLYTSSACVYPKYLQHSPQVTPLEEKSAYPADPEDAYGWEKLYAERLCRHYREDFGVETRVVRFHNIYGTLGTYDGGREKSPAAICRKIALAKDGDEIEVWGDGKQTRSYCYVDDAVEGLVRVMSSDYQDPLNVGRNDLISIADLVDLVAKIGSKTIVKRFDPSKPKGVMGRNSDNTLIREVLGWEPSIGLETGLKKTYNWIKKELERRK